MTTNPKWFTTALDDRWSWDQSQRLGKPAALFCISKHPDRAEVFYDGNTARIVSQQYCQSDGHYKCKIVSSDGMGGCDPDAQEWEKEEVPETELMPNERQATPPTATPSISNSASAPSSKRKRGSDSSDDSINGSSDDSSEDEDEDDDDEEEEEEEEDDDDEDDFEDVKGRSCEDLQSSSYSSSSSSSSSSDNSDNEENEGGATLVAKKKKSSKRPAAPNSKKLPKKRAKQKKQKKQKTTKKPPMTMIILRMGMRPKSKTTGAKFVSDTKPVVTTEVPASDSGEMKLLRLLGHKEIQPHFALALRRNPQFPIWKNPH